MNAIRSLACALALAIAAASTAPCQGPRPSVTVDWSKTDQRIAWHGTWKGALQSAEATGRPILLVFAAPHCSQVPGMW